jgi:hypothetical protein
MISDDIAPDNIVANPMRRRWWLLQKALEDCSLRDALRLAQSADVFLTTNHKICNCATYEIDTQTVRSLVPAVETPSENEAASEQFTAHSQSLQSSPNAKQCDPVNWGSNGANAATTQRDAEGEAQVDMAAPIDRSMTQVEQETPPSDAEGENGNHPASDADASLAVWATIDDVVRYLRQRDDVVVSAGKHKFLVNGRFHEDGNALVIRANRMRERQRKPPFYLAPPT